MADFGGQYYSGVKSTDADYNIAYGTADRMNVCLWKVNGFYELQDYVNMLHQLEILFDEISTFVDEINSKDGKLNPDNEFKEAQRLEKNCVDLSYTCMVTYRDGTKRFTPTAQLIGSLREYQRYLRALMFKYKIYTKTRDNTLAAAKVG